MIRAGTRTEGKQEERKRSWHIHMMGHHLAYYMKSYVDTYARKYGHSQETGWFTYHMSGNKYSRVETSGGDGIEDSGSRGWSLHLCGESCWMVSM
jgi:hypothetical protein